MRTKYRIGAHDIAWEVKYGKARRLICDELLLEFYSHAVICFNENIDYLQPQAIMKRLKKLEEKNEQKTFRKISKIKSRRKKNL